MAYVFCDWGCCMNVVEPDMTSVEQKGVTWKLEDIYNSITDEKLLSDKLLVETKVLDFCEAYKDRLNTENLFNSIEEYESIRAILERVAAYSFLYIQTRLHDQEALSFYQKNSEWLTDIESRLVFYTNEIAKLNHEEALERSGKYRSWVDGCFRFKDHMLSNEAEEVLSKKSMTSIQSWNRLYDEMLTRMEFDYEGTKKSLPEILEMMSHSDSQEERDRAARSFGELLKKESFYVKHIYNNVILDSTIDSNLRRFEKPESFRHLSNNIGQTVVDSLVEAVVRGYEKTAHKYYKIKAGLLKLKRFEYWDRNAPVRLSGILDRKVEYRDACDTVVKVFGKFSKIFGDIASDFIDKSWIDVYPSSSKTSGAFSHPCSTEIHPYILLNYFGTERDISTLAHELGHGIHQTLSAKNGTLLSETPITLSEVASLFAEKLLFEHMYGQVHSNLEKIDLLCSKLDDTINSVMRQIAFFRFERKAYDMRRDHELSVEELNRIFIETQKECLGDGVNVDPIVGYFWTYISHFYQSPFYVYAYAFGELFTNALYEVYKERGKSFVDKYIEMLSKGGIERYDEAAKKFGLDPNDLGFWEKGLKAIEEQIRLLEKLCDSEVFS